ncbi:unnamed protein product [Citrullus colocynthis]|uniref:DC1 domain-containing protein n=1 Tax=Citrullus colocynthis TaxID=252529 RepID=A0ABP0XSI2_9ROSI
MVPHHHFLLPPSQIQHGYIELENLHPIYSLVRSRPSILDLEDETLPSYQSASSSHDGKRSNNNQQERKREQERERVLCCACHKPLTIIGVQSPTLCYICNKLPSTYFCGPCSNGWINFFDKRCSELPKEIHYPYHPHPLTMRIRKNSNCCVCGKSCGDFNYGCDNGCNFIVDIKCLLKEKKKFDGPITSVRKFMGLVYDL